MQAKLKGFYLQISAFANPFDCEKHEGNDHISFSVENKKLEIPKYETVSLFKQT